MTPQTLIDWTKGNLAKFDATAQRLYTAYKVAAGQSTALQAQGVPLNQILIDRARQTLMYIAKVRNGLEQVKPFAEEAVAQNMLQNGLSGFLAPVAGILGTAYAANNYVSSLASLMERQNQIDAQTLQLIAGGATSQDARTQAGKLVDTSLVSPLRFSPVMLLLGGVALVYVLA